MRLPSNDPVTAMKASDAGSYGRVRPWSNPRTVSSLRRKVRRHLRGPRRHDLAPNLGISASSAATEPEDATARCLVAAKAAGARVGIFRPCVAAARRRTAERFDLVVPGNDVHLLNFALAAELRDANPDHRRAI